MQCDSRQIAKFGFSPVNTEYKKVLFLGTHITQKSLDAGFYYFNVSNWFWSLIKGVYSSEELTNKVNAYIERLKTVKKANGSGSCRKVLAEETTEQRIGLIDCLQKHGIVINDLIGLCECSGAKDDQIIWAEPNNGQNGFHDVPSLMKEADLVVVNGKGLMKNGATLPNSARDFMRRFGFDTQVDSSKVVYVCGSTPGSPGFEAKQKNWIESIGNVKR